MRFGVWPVADCLLVEAFSTNRKEKAADKEV
jgi:hypothetical protein